MNGVEASVEHILVRAEKLALSMLSARARALIIVLKSLGEGEKTVEQLREACALYGFRCRGLEKALQLLSEWGLVECSGGRCRLTSEGAELSASLADFLRELREYAYSVARGSATEYDVFSHVATPLASTVGVVESYVEDPESINVSLAIHAYVSTLSAAVTSLLTRIRPELVSMIKTVYEG